MSGRAPQWQGPLRAAEVIGWVIGIIAVGSVLVALVAVALGVSERVGFGPWGATCVFVCAVAVGLLVWRRGAQRSGSSHEKNAGGHVSPTPSRTGWQPTKAGRVTVTELPTDLVRPVDRSVRKERTAAEPTLPAGPSRLGYYAAMDEQRTAEARRIVEALRAAGEDGRWCDNALHRIRAAPPGR